MIMDDVGDLDLGQPFLQRSQIGVIVALILLAFFVVRQVDGHGRLLLSAVRTRSRMVERRITHALA